MPKLGIVTDSTCDIEPSELAKLDVEMVPLSVHFGDTHFRDWIDLQPEEFYRKLQAAAALPTTSQPPPAEFLATYCRLAEQGCEEILVITLASALSGTYESASLAAKDAPVNVRVLDGRRASLGTGLILHAAVAAREAGLDMDGVEGCALQVAQSTRLFFLLDTMEYLVKGGRAGIATALAASLLNIKPVLQVNAEGVVEPFKKVRGRQQAIATLAQHVADESRHFGRLRVALLHAQVEGEAEELESALVAANADVDIMLRGVIGAVIGTYTGPGAVGIAYYPIG